MRLITAIVRPEKLDELITALIDNGVHGLTVTDVRGFGSSTASSLPTRPRPRRVVQLVARSGAPAEGPAGPRRARRRCRDDGRGHRQACPDRDDRRREDLGDNGRQRPARPDRRARSCRGMTPGSASAEMDYVPVGPRTPEAGARRPRLLLPRHQAAVLVVMPATTARPHETELLLCGHHYRVSRQATPWPRCRLRRTNCPGRRMAPRPVAAVSLRAERPGLRFPPALNDSQT